MRKHLRKLKKPILKIIQILRIAFARKGIFFNKKDRKLWSIYGSAKGRDAVVIGMGPSFQKEDIERFENYQTFACNKIYLIGEEMEWRPDFYCVTDFLVAENNVEKINEYSGTMKYVYPDILDSGLELHDVIPFLKDKSRTTNDKVTPFNDNPIDGLVCGGGTVLLALIQMAHWAGCKKIYVVGVDFSFNGGLKTQQKIDCGDNVLLSEGEINHFHPDYRKSGETWTEPRYEEQERGFKYAEEALRMCGVQLLNASRETKLKALKRVDFDEVFPRKS